MLWRDRSITIKELINKHALLGFLGVRWFWRESSKNLAHRGLCPNLTGCLQGASSAKTPLRRKSPSTRTVGQGGPFQESKCPRTKKGKKAAASQRASAGQPKAKGQESPETKVSHPMETRQRASRAGSLRGVVGSGQTGYVCDTEVTLP
jgi:hypothetical protein